MRDVLGSQRLTNTLRTNHFSATFFSLKNSPLTLEVPLHRHLQTRLLQDPLSSPTSPTNPLADKRLLLDSLVVHSVGEGRVGGKMTALPTTSSSPLFS